MKTKKTMLFIAAMFGGIIATSLTSCGDESTEDIPEVPKDTAENQDIEGKIYSLQVTLYSSTGFVETRASSVPKDSELPLGEGVFFNRRDLEGFTFYEGDTLDVIMSNIMRQQYATPADGTPISYYYTCNVKAAGSNPVRSLFKDVSAIYYLTDGNFEVKLLEKDTQGKTWSAVVNRKPNGFDAYDINNLDTLDVLTVANNTDERFYPMRSGDLLTVRLAGYETEGGQPSEWAGNWRSKGADDLHYHIIAPLIAYYGY